jgi:tetratricopeptide (TPR) repeat protein
MPTATAGVLRRTCSTILLTLLLHALAGTADAASGATLAGTVLDDQGNPLKGIGVTIRGGDAELGATTDKKGRFKISVPDASAQYEIRFDREGFRPYVAPLTFAKSGTQTIEWKITATPEGSPTDSMAALRAYNDGVVAYNDGDFDRALHKFGEAVVEDPEFVDAHELISDIYYSKQDYEQALRAADRVLELAPENASAVRTRYLCQLDLGRDGASATLDRLAELDPGPPTAVLLFNEGVVARAAGDEKQALARYEAATRMDPEFVRAHAALASLYLKLGNQEAALASSGRALELDPTDARGMSIRYNTFIAMGRNEEAQQMIDELKRVAPDAVADAYFERGALLFDQGHIEQAIPALELAIDADPELARGHYTLAMCYLNRDRKEDARRHLTTFLELAPDDPDADSARQLLEILGRSD